MIPCIIMGATPSNEHVEKSPKRDLKQRSIGLRVRTFECELVPASNAIVGKVAFFYLPKGHYFAVRFYPLRAGYPMYNVNPVHLYATEQERTNAINKRLIEFRQYEAKRK